jgi:predicted ArsR family transcriptional regulator
VQGTELTHSDLQRPILGASRTRVLRVVQAARKPVGVDEVAERVGLHANSTRFHLDALLAQGLVEKVSEQRDVPGRPRSLYTPTVESVGVGQRNYRLLAEILSSYLASHAKQPGQAAIDAGQAWGRFLTETAAPRRKITAATATRRLVAALDEIGFEPEAVSDGRTRKVLLHHCPFREAVAANREVVCGVHLGMMQGLLSELDAPIEAHRLDAFVEPSLCIARLGARDTDAAPLVAV